MSTLSGLGNLSKTRQVNLVTENLAIADQQLNSQPPAPYLEVEGGSVASRDNWKSILSVPSPNTADIKQPSMKLFEDSSLFSPALEFEVMPGSMTQTEDMYPFWESTPKVMPWLEDGESYPYADELSQQFNSLDSSQREGEVGVCSFEPVQSHMDHAGQASNGRIQKGLEPVLTPVGKAKSKLHQAETSYPTAMSSLGDGEGYPNANELPQQLNSLDKSQRDVEDGVGCFETDPSQRDHGGQVSDGRLKKGREPMLKSMEKAKNKLDQAGTSSPAAMSSLGDEEGYPNGNEMPQQFNSLDDSQTDVGDGVRCSEPERSRLVLDGQASNGRIGKGREPMLRPEEKAKKTLNQAGTSSPTAMSSLGDREGYSNAAELPQQLNSLDNFQRDRVGWFKPDPSHFDHGGQASSRRIPKGRKPMLKPVEKARRTHDQAGTSSPTAMPSLGDGEGYPNVNELSQPFGSYYDSQLRNVEERVQCFGPNSSNLDHADQGSNRRTQEARKPRLPPVKKGKCQLDQAGTSDEACTGKKRKAREPLTEAQKAERKKKKTEADKKYKQKKELELNELKSTKQQYHRVMEILSRFWGIDLMELYNSELQTPEQKQLDYDNFLQSFETELHQLGQMKSKYGGINEMESMLDKFKQKEADLHRFEQMKSKFGGTEQMESMLDKFHEVEAEVNRPTEIEVEVQPQDNHKQKELPSFQESTCNLQEMSGSQSLNLNGDSNMVSDECGISLNSSAAVKGAKPDMQYHSDEFVDQLIARLTDGTFPSNLDPDSFKDLLEGECKSVDKFKIPPSLVSTACDILKVYGDIMKESKYIGPTVQTIFVFFCAAIKEMGDRSLDEVTEKIIWKWRGPIIDAKRSEFDVEFAMEHLKAIVQGYFGLKARKDRDCLNQRIASLRDDEQALRSELEKKSNEIKAVESKLGDLTSKKCKICQESADKFLGKMVGIF